MIKNLDPKTEIPSMIQVIDTLMERLEQIEDAPPGATTVSGDILFKSFDIQENLNTVRNSLQEFAVAIDTEYERTKIPVQICQCVDMDNSACPIHTVGHAYTSGCCDQPEDTHRHLTDAEYENLYPEVFHERIDVGKDSYGINARRYPSGVGVTIAWMFKEEANEEDGTGLCFDIDLDGLKGILPALDRLAKTVDV